MAKFHGKVGYNQGPVESPSGSGVYVPNIIEKTYFGDVIRNTRKIQEGTIVNEDLSVQNSISIVADAYANLNFFAIRYVEWLGGLWTVYEVVVEAPRLVLRLGGVYNGPTPAP